VRRRDFLRTAAGAVGAPALLAQTRPNIVLIMADQMRGDCVHAAGNRAIETPHLDRIANHGVLFRAAYSSTPTCTPARAALLTGMSPWNHGMLGYGAVAEKYRVELPRLLSDAGYYTLGIGKMHWRPQRALHGFHRTILDESGREETPGFRSDYRSWFWSEAPGANPDATGIDWNGFDARPYALPERLHPTAWAGDTAVRFLREHSKSQPFFLKVSMERPHSPYDPPKRWWDRYEGKTLPPAAIGAWADKYRPRSDDGPAPWHGDLGPDTVRRARQGYYGAVGFVDEQVGRIVDAIEARGQSGNTLVLFTSDHGDMLGDHHLWRKSYAYEASARIPMLMQWPDRIQPRQTVGKPVELRDVLPTFLDAAGARVPDGIDGRSLLRTEGEWREWLDLEHDVCYSPANHWNALTDGRRKYIFHAPTATEQFFDLERDPHELREITGPELAAWRERLAKHLAVRGREWVLDGKLMARPNRQLYSPNYPK
jgi:arylsulfatase A-like enzyme